MQHFEESNQAPNMKVSDRIARMQETMKYDDNGVWHHTPKEVVQYVHVCIPDELFEVLDLHVSSRRVGEAAEGLFAFFNRMKNYHYLDLKKGMFHDSLNGQEIRNIITAAAEL